MIGHGGRVDQHLLVKPGAVISVRKELVIVQLRCDYVCMCRIICRGGVVVKGNSVEVAGWGIGRISTYWGSLDAMVTAGRRTEWTGSGGKSRGEGDRIDGDGSPGPSGR